MPKPPTGRELNRQERQWPVHRSLEWRSAFLETLDVHGFEVDETSERLIIHMPADQLISNGPRFKQFVTDLCLEYESDIEPLTPVKQRQFQSLLLETFGNLHHHLAPEARAHAFVDVIFDKTRGSINLYGKSYAPKAGLERFRHKIQIAAAALGFASSHGKSPHDYLNARELDSHPSLSGTKTAGRGTIWTMFGSDGITLRQLSEAPIMAKDSNDNEMKLLPFEFNILFQKSRLADRQANSSHIR